MRVLVQGRRGDQDELEEQIKEYDDEAIVEFSDDIELVAALERFVHTDVIICYVTEETFEGAFISDVLDRYPYVPAVIVGGPSDERISPLTLGGAFYLPSGAPARLIAFEADRAMRAAWWSGVAEIDVPFLVVDRATQQVVRANQAGLDAYGASLVGQSYCGVVEHSSMDEMNEDHPITQVFRSGSAVSRFYKISPTADDGRWIHLICRPIFGLKKNVRAVGVLITEADRWARILNATTSFHEQPSLKSLQEEIVRQARNLGFERVRLYRWYDGEKLFRGVSCTGLSPKNESWFRNEFAFSIDDDEPSQITIVADRELPRLFINRSVDGQNGSSRTPRECESDLVRYSEPLRPVELEMNGVARWIEVPLLVPIGTEMDGETSTNSRRLWGKLCVDLGENSAQLNHSHAADMALFASAVSSAIAVVDRAEMDRRHLELFKQYSQKFSQAPWRQRKNEILPHVIQLLLELYLEITDADVVFYRKKRGEDTLELSGQPRWRGDVPDSEICRVPHRKNRGEGTSSEILEADPPKPKIVNHARVAATRCADNANPGRFEPAEEQFLRQIGSEIHLPLIVHGDLRGAVVAVSFEENVFSPDLMIAIDRFMHLAGLWYELGELHDGHRWSPKTIKKLIGLLPKLAGAEKDDTFFAVMAAMLTAHDGLGWNRTFIFQCRGRDPSSAELVYALGGKDPEEHAKIMEKAEHIPLEELLWQRLDNHLPGEFIEATERFEIDTLYQELCLKEDARILIPFGKGAREYAFEQYLKDHQIDGAWVEPKQLHPLKWILEQDYSEANRVADHHLLGRSAWTDFIDLRHDVVFREGFYAFPLWRTFDTRQKPLGVVVLEMSEHAERPVEQTLPATVVFLDLVSDILAFRNLESVVRDWVGRIHASHDFRLKERWDVAAGTSRKLFAASSDPEIAADPKFKDCQRYLASLERNYEQLNVEVDQVAAALATDGKKEKVDDLGHFLDRLVKGWEKEAPITVGRDFTAANGISLQCPAKTLEETLNTLKRNSVRAFHESSGEELKVRIDVKLEATPTDRFTGVLAIHFSDNGPGIAREIASQIFLHGFTMQHEDGPIRSTALNRHGKGLSIARAQLLMHRGDVQYLDADSPERDSSMRGAQFMIRFGLPREDRVHTPTTTL